ncbi:MAG: FAD-dependent oxidoreductase, partial [Clostridia bacterium]|nr:FAD-dependent oxidoreductase [Clostridia bacterium]
MLKVQIKLPLSYNDETIKTTLAKSLKIDAEKIKTYKLLKLSVDARDKSNVIFNASVAVKVNANESRILHKCKNVSEYKPTTYTFKKSDVTLTHRPVVIGAGPAGLFCAYILANVGL